ncbi:MAG: acyl-CoA carboxylase subunit epsilon [Streptosporangiaceae bacterium]
MTSGPAEQPMLSVVSGRPTTEEVAAVTAVISAVLAARQRAAAGRAAMGPAPSAWLDRATLTRTPLRPGPGAWRRSGRPA